MLVGLVAAQVRGMARLERVGVLDLEAAQLRSPLAHLCGGGKRENVCDSGRRRQENGSGEFFYSSRSFRHRLARELTASYFNNYMTK